MFNTLAFVLALTLGAPGGVDEPIRFVGDEKVDLAPHDAGLRPPVGVSNYQVLRANRTHPESAEDCGWTYNHAPMIAYWNGRFYLEYLSNPQDEHIAPGQTLLATSPDGRTWSKPQVVFPPYVPPRDTPMPDKYNGYMMHQRMGFYVARQDTEPDGRLLVLGFYGHAEDPFREGGIGRVVRELYKDGSFGPIYFIRYTSHAPWNESNTSYAFYKKSPDPGFVAACDALLADRLKTLQWYDEDRGLDGFYTIREAGQAFNWFQRKDGKVVGLWKRSLAAISEDGGETFSKPAKCPTLVMAGGKQWGQQTEDGRYAILYNPTTMDEHRYPLAIITGDDGITFDHMLVVHGEVPPRRFFGRWKDFGPCYVRGIVQGNGNPPGSDVWVTYSVNKEDIWVSRIPVPVKWRVDESVHDDFESILPNSHVNDWNIYNGIWATARVKEVPGSNGKALCLVDKDPCDYARATRVFKQAQTARIQFNLTPGQSSSGRLEIDVADAYGQRALQIGLGQEGRIVASNGGKTVVVAPYKANVPLAMDMKVDAAKDTFTLAVDGKDVLTEAALAANVETVERLSFRTGPHRTEPTRQTVNETPHDPLPGADEPVEEAAFWIDDVRID